MTATRTLSNEISLVINTREEWQAILSRGAEIVWETKYFKVFKLDGKLWRVMPQWRRAWPFDIIEK
jgi:hypothetical protein